MSQIDIKGKKLIYELDKDARLPITQLSKQIGLSKEATRYRLQKLTESGGIKGFITYLDFTRLGFFGYCIYCRYNAIDEEKQTEIKKYLKDHDKIYWIAEYGGKYDLSFSILAKNPLEFDKILSEILNKYSPFLTDITLITKLEPHKYDRKYLFKDNQIKSKRTLMVEPYNLTLLEKNIIKSLAVNARISAAEIAENLKKPLSTVIYNIKNLNKEGIIQGSTIILDTEKVMGFQTFQVNIKIKNISDKRMSELLIYCEKHPNIIYAIKVLGDWNFEIIYEVEKAKKMQECLLELRNKFNDIIKESELINLFEDYIKLNHYPFKD